MAPADDVSPDRLAPPPAPPEPPGGQRKAPKGELPPGVVRMRLAGRESAFHHGIDGIPPLTRDFVDVPVGLAKRLRELCSAYRIHLEEIV